MVKSSRKARTSCLPQPEALEQIARGRLLDASPLAGRRVRRGIGGQPGGQQLLVAGDEGVALAPRQPLLATRARLLDRRFHLQRAAP